MSEKPIALSHMTMSLAMLLFKILKFAWAQTNLAKLTGRKQASIIGVLHLLSPPLPAN